MQKREKEGAGKGMPCALKHENRYKYGCPNGSQQEM